MTHTYTRTVVPKLGLRRRDRSRAVLPLTLTGAVPTHPATADYLDTVGVWNGETNFQFGTCGPVSVANSAISTWWWCLGQHVTVSDSAIFKLYKASGNPDFNPDTGEGDNGVEMTVMLSALLRQGLDITLPGGGVSTVKPICFAAAQFPGTYDDLHAVTSIFGGETLAADLDVAQQDQTDAGLWDYMAGSDPWGGHAFHGGAYTSATGAHELDVSQITWKMRCGMTPGFINHQLAEVYVIVWEPTWEHDAFQQGVDQQAMAADFTAVTGRAWPGPAPAPSPIEPSSFAAEWAAGIPGGVQAWCRQVRTRPDLVTLKRQLQSAAAGEGLPL
jgi:hypothetical protein